MRQRFRCSILMLVAGSANTLSAYADERPAGVVRVPKLVGKQIAVARQMSRIAGLQVARGEYYLSRATWRNGTPSDAVSMQSPQPGTAVAESSTVACWVFRKAAPGQKIVVTPKLHGLSIEEAARRLNERGLRIMFSRLDTVGSVHSQYPVEGQRVFTGTSVYVTLKSTRE